MINLDIFDSLQDGVLVLSEDTQIQYCNEAAALLTGLPVRRILRNKVTLGDIIYFDKKPTWMDALGTVKDSTTYQELSFSNVMGEHGRIQISVQPIASDPNDGPRWLVYLRDVRLEEVLQKKYRDELEQKEGFIAELQRAQTKLINYSKNLESMVQERTHEIKDLNVQMKALLDSLSQGFLIFNESGDCLSIFSQACLTTLERSPLHQKIWDVLSLSPAETISFKKWLVALFGHLLPFEDLKPLGPLTYKHTKGRSISLDFFPLMNSTSFVNDKLNGVVMVATDITELVEAQRQFESEKIRPNLFLLWSKSRLKSEDLSRRPRSYSPTFSKLPALVNGLNIKRPSFVGFTHSREAQDHSRSQNWETTAIRLKILLFSSGRNPRQALNLLIKPSLIFRFQSMTSLSTLARSWVREPSVLSPISLLK
jgi:two-component system chemotaxis sensor kinase CheA